jgi:type II secretory pathway pseudopilin PulG
MFTRRNCERGASALELIVTAAILGLLLTTTTTATTTMIRRSGLREATFKVRSLLEIANAEGQTLGRYRGVRFTQRGSEWFYAIYEDGNGNGVLTDDILAGTDRLIDGPRPLVPPGSMVHVGFPISGVTDPDTNVTIAAGTRPVQFGKSNLCSFSDYGSCTPGSIYLTDGISTTAMIRCSGASGRIRVAYYGLTSSRWSE